ncbi:MAG: SusC/RagA family TonB-linked outer membrane protein [Bacteroidetes bacterium]|nr:SusC/RagA family TonB-linked outer membrane protein [Bacteroidota bacterium]
MNQIFLIMRRFTIWLTCLFFLISIGVANAQTSVVTGTVTSSEDGLPIPGVTIVVPGTTDGTTTDLDGKYTLSVKDEYTTLRFQFVGMITQEVSIGTSTTINVALDPDILLMDEVVVTALGVSREKKSLGYAVQKVQGDQLNTVKSDNFLNSISGKVSGVHVKRNNNLGGSTNIVIRGSTSLQGNNQALFVVDGVPISNRMTNTMAQMQGDGNNYDFGNPASDINPDDIESMSVLKGAAATALYGSRAANGVIMITTKKGKKNSGLGITVNSGISVGSIDKSTFVEYQKDYGAGYGPYYDGPGLHWNISNGSLFPDGELYVLSTEDASYGAAFDPSLMVYQWDAFYPGSPTYLTKTPWVAAPNDPSAFFDTPVSYNNSVSIENGDEFGSYRLSYTNLDQKGILPNSELKKNTLTFSGDYDVSDNLKVAGFANYIRTETVGRSITGYNDNLMGMFRQWGQTNVDILHQKEMYELLGTNATWNPHSPTSLTPEYWNNAYWQRDKSYENDGRNRFLGNVSATYKITDWLSIFGRISVDTYSELQEIRKAVGSVAGRFGVSRLTQSSGYSRRNINFEEFNSDLMLNINKQINESLSFSSILGVNVRRTHFNSIFASTAGGLIIPDLYSLQNTVDVLPLPQEIAEKVGVDGMYGNVSLGYKNTFYLESSIRRDYSSTLPADNNVYYYPSISGSFVFSELLMDQFSWLSYGKFRLNYAEVGNSATFDQINDTYNIATSFNSAVMSVNNTKKNSTLRPERTKSIETGIEAYFFDKRIGFDLAVYKTNSIDQILPVAVSRATGYSYKVVNAGEIENKGIELSIMGTPVRDKNFEWNINVNWTKSTNKVLSLAEDLENLELGSFQGGVSVNARVGEAYGAIYGTDYTYDDNGNRYVDASSGEFIITSTNDNVLGNVNPDWIAGIYNSFRYKDLSFSFLIDIQQGGDLFSLDMHYGMATGMYPETSFINDLGNPVRNTLDEGGGFINEGVNPDGTVNTTRIDAHRYGAFGYRRNNPNKAFIYDAGYVKLREVAISYNLPKRLYSRTSINDVTFSFVASNLWIISKNLPYADPEAGLSAGNLQGYIAGAMPTTRTFAFNVKLRF